VIFGILSANRGMCTSETNKQLAKFPDIDITRKHHLPLF